MSGRITAVVAEAGGPGNRCAYFSSYLLVPLTFACQVEIPHSPNRSAGLFTVQPARRGCISGAPDGDRAGVRLPRPAGKRGQRSQIVGSLPVLWSKCGLIWPSARGCPASSTPIGPAAGAVV